MEVIYSFLKVSKVITEASSVNFGGKKVDIGLKLPEFICCLHWKQLFLLPGTNIYVKLQKSRLHCFCDSPWLKEVLLSLVTASVPSREQDSWTARH